MAPSRLPAAALNRSAASAVLLLAGAILGTLAGGTDAGGRSAEAALEADARIHARYGSLPLHFEPNVGQSAEIVKFVSRGPGYGLFLTGTDAVIALTPAGNKERGTNGHRESLSQVLRMRLSGANPAAQPRSEARLPGVSNYFLGNDPARWRTDVPHFARARFEGVYAGVDVVYYGNQGQLEYDFVVEPGADPDQIRMEIDGATGARLDTNGDLVLSVGPGEVRQLRPVVYQETDAGRALVEGRFQLLADASAAGHPVRLGFELGAYDRDRELVIDPILTFSSFLGGSAGDAALAAEVDPGGHLYMTGSTFSPNFPSTPGAFNSILKGNDDVVVTKVDPSGTALVFSTYIGGTTGDAAVALALDPDGNAYLAGVTFSTDFPTTPGAFDRVHGANSSRDAFALKLGAAGNSLGYSTFLGGTGEEGFLFDMGLMVDPARDLWVSGTTTSVDFPVTGNAISITRNGPSDAWVTKLNVNGSGLLYSTYLGGSANESARGIAPDGGAGVYVVGSTTSQNFPRASVGFDSTIGSTSFADGFISRVVPGLSAPLYSSYIGGSLLDDANAVAVDAGGHVFVFGSTNGGTGFPTSGAFDPTHNGQSDAFMVVVDPQVTGPDSLVYGTFFGGSSNDFGNGLAVDPQGNVTVTGATASSNFPLNRPLIDFRQGVDDAFVTRFIRFAPGLFGLVYSTYLGGSGPDTGYDVALDPSGAAYVVGTTGSTDFPTHSPLQGSYGGGSNDAFFAKLSPQPPSAPFNLQAADVRQNQVLLVWESDDTASAWVVERSDAMGPFDKIATVDLETGPTHLDTGLSPNTEYRYRVFSRNSEGVSPPTNELRITTLPNPPPAPEGVTAAALSQTVVDVAWSSTADNEDGFEVQRQRDGSGVFVVAGTTGPDQHRFLDSGLSANTTYRYQVRAFNKGGFSPFSTPAPGTTLPNPPARPNLIALFRLPAEIYVEVDAERFDPGTTFEIEAENAEGQFVRFGVISEGRSLAQPAPAGGGMVRLRARAQNRGGVSAWSEIVTVILPQTPPPVPSELGATPLSPSQVRLSWRDNSSNELRFEIEGSQDGGATYVPFAPARANATSHVLGALLPDTEYRFRIRAASDGGPSPFTDPVTVRTLVPPPPAPTDLQVTLVNPAGVFLRWQHDVSLVREAAYRLSRKGPGNSLREFAIAAANREADGTVRFTDTEIAPNTVYTYWVNAFNSGGVSPASNEVTVTVPGPVPAPPGSVLASLLTPTSIRVTWQNVAVDATGIQVERQAGAGTGFLMLRSLAPDTTSLDDTGLAPNTGYTYRLRTGNAAGFSTYSNEASASTPAAPPAPPADLRARFEPGAGVILTWTLVPGNGGYELQRATPGTVFAPIGTVEATSTTFTDATTDGISNREFVYRLASRQTFVLATGDRQYSNEARVTVPPAPPSAPAGLSARAVSSSVIALRWTDTSPNEDRFEVERAEGPGEFRGVSSVRADVNTYFDSGLRAGQQYRYRVRAVNAGGASGYSNEANGTTEADAASASGKLQVNPSRVRFTRKGAKSKQVELRNTGRGTLRISLGDLPGPYSVEGAGTVIVLRAGARRRVTVRITGGQGTASGAGAKVVWEIATSEARRSVVKVPVSGGQ